MTIRNFILMAACAATAFASPAQAETLASVPCGDEARVVMRAADGVVSATLEGPHGTAYGALERVAVVGEVVALRNARGGFDRLTQLCGVAR